MEVRDDEMNRAEQEVNQREFPIEKSDIHWGTEEVTMERDKFEALIGYLQDVSQRLVEAEDELSFQRYDTRKAEKAADVFLGLSASLSETEEGIQRWLADPKNSIQELSRRTEIPYATCHRIVTERLADARIETGQLKKLAKAIGEKSVAKGASRSPAEQRTRDIFAPILGAKLTGETLKALGEFAMKSGITMVFTGVRGKKKTEPIEKILAVGDVTDMAKEKG